MVKFSCFFIPNPKSKKIRQVGAPVHTSSEKKTRDRENKVLSGSPSTNPKANQNNLSNITSPCSHEDGWKLEDAASINSDDPEEDNEEFEKRMHMKKSQSLGCIFNEEEYSGDDDVIDDDDDEIDGEISFNRSHQKSMMRMNGSLDDITSTELIESFDMISENAYHESLFSLEALQQFDGAQHAADRRQSPYQEEAEDSGCCLSPEDIPPAFERSQSATPTQDSMTHEVKSPQSRCFQNLPFANQQMAEFPDRDDVLLRVHLHREGFDSDKKSSTNGYDFHDSNALVNVGREFETDDAKLKKKIQQGSPILSCDKLDPKEFSIRRIQDWISQIDTENGCVEEPGESSAASLSSTKEPQVESDVLLPTTKPPDAKSHVGMEAAYDYMKSLTTKSAGAQMANLGLVSVPFLSDFVGLRALNLSGNAIGRITTGALPRGLNMLNLSKNNIVVIEGLRDLTRLHVLDLSYNQIIRIGHGLATCSSLKELYLAGNKISEIEGLHRLLKLSVLDLRSNKISTAKGLGQLAANSVALESVNLDGNPAQKNVGDEQLKKYLLGLLPNLGHYNKQAIRTPSSSPKEISDRPPPRASVVRAAEHKLPPRKGSLNPAARPNHAAVGPSARPASRVPPNAAELRHLQLPPIGGPKLSYNRMPEAADKKPTPSRPPDQWGMMAAMGLGGSMAAVHGYR